MKKLLLLLVFFIPLLLAAQLPFGSKGNVSVFKGPVALDSAALKPFDSTALKIVVREGSNKKLFTTNWPLSVTGSSSVSTTVGGGVITLTVPTSYINAADYTPTLTGILNTDAVTLVSAHYMRINDQVSVDVALTIDPTASATLTNVDITLPIASTMTNFTNLTGIVTSGDGGIGNTVAVSNKARIGFAAAGTVNTTYNVHFMYKIQ